MRSARVLLFKMTEDFTHEPLSMPEQEALRVSGRYGAFPIPPTFWRSRTPGRGR